MLNVAIPATALALAVVKPVENVPPTSESVMDDAAWEALCRGCGLAQLLDMAGMDIYTAVASYLNRDLSNEAGVSKTIGDLVAQGRLGMKTKGGLFDYTDEQIGQLRAQRGASLVKVRKALS